MYRNILDSRPDDADALHYLGLSAYQSGRFEAALDMMRRSVALRPDAPHFHGNLGNACRAAGLWAEAIAAYLEALRRNPAAASARVNLGNTLWELGKPDEALAHFEQALSLAPRCAEAHLGAGLALLSVGRLDEALAAFDAAIRLAPDPRLAHDNRLYTLLFHPDYDASRIHEEHRRWNQQHGASLGPRIQPHSVKRTANRRLRIGYVSPDFREHVVGRNLLPLLREHDHQQFKIVCYSLTTRRDAMTEQFAKYADSWHDIVGLGDDAMAERVRDDRINILVDLSLHMAGNRLSVFARNRRRCRLHSPVIPARPAYRPSTTDLPIFISIRRDATIINIRKNRSACPLPFGATIRRPAIPRSARNRPSRLATSCSAA